MMRLPWWPVPTVLVYAGLVCFSWVFSEDGAHAAQRLESRSMDSGFQPLSRREKGSSPRKKSAAKVPYSRIRRTQTGYSLEYGFRNYNNDILTMKSEFSAETVADSIREFGYSQSAFKDLDAWYQRSQKQAIKTNEERYITGKVQARTRAELDMKLQFMKDHNAGVQKDLDAELDRLAGEYRKRRLGIYEKGGFRFKEKGVVEADIPEMVRRNWRRMRPLAKAFQAISDRKNYDAEDLVGAVTAMVQTGMRYEIPATREGSRVIAGVLPPPKALVLGQGDCDTKTAVIAAILSNWPNLKLVGLGIPGHYLMAYHRIPRSGDVFIEFEGLQYVMIESAGPAWIRPGEVGDSTLEYLQSGQTFRIQPIKI